MQYKVTQIAETQLSRQWRYSDSSVCKNDKNFFDCFIRFDSFDDYIQHNNSLQIFNGQSDGHMLQPPVLKGEKIGSNNPLGIDAKTYAHLNHVLQDTLPVECGVNRVLMVMVFCAIQVMAMPASNAVEKILFVYMSNNFVAKLLNVRHRMTIKTFKNV